MPKPSIIGLIRSGANYNKRITDNVVTSVTRHVNTKIHDVDKLLHDVFYWTEAVRWFEHGGQNKQKNC